MDCLRLATDDVERSGGFAIEEIRAMRRCGNARLRKLSELLRLRAACRENSESATIAKLSRQRDESGVFGTHWLVRAGDDVSELTRIRRGVSL